MENASLIEDIFLIKEEEMRLNRQGCKLEKQECNEVQERDKAHKFYDLNGKSFTRCVSISKKR